MQIIFILQNRCMHASYFLACNDLLPSDMLEKEEDNLNVNLCDAALYCDTLTNLKLVCLCLL